MTTTHAAMGGVEDAAAPAGNRGGTNDHIAGDRIQRNRPGRQREGQAALRIPHDLPDDTRGAALGYAGAEPGNQRGGEVNTELMAAPVRIQLRRHVDVLLRIANPGTR